MHFSCYFAKLREAYGKAYPLKSKQKIHEDVITIWNDHKKKDNVKDIILEEIRLLTDKIRKRDATFRGFWANLPQPPSRGQSNVSDISGISECSSNEETTKESSSLEEHETDGRLLRHVTVFLTPAQSKIQQNIDLLNSDLVCLYKRRSLGLMTDEQQRNIKETEQQLKKLVKELILKKKDQKRQRVKRLQHKESINKIFDLHPDAKKVLKARKQSGRPRIEEDQTDLLQTICDIAIHGSAVDEKRRTELFRSIKTLNELREELLSIGFHLSRSALYLRLLPKRSSSSEGKRHIKTVPVRLLRSRNDQHKGHSDTNFAAATIHNMEEMASYLGPKEVCFVSCDDKAKVCIGLTAATKQSPILMHLEYKVSLPDHDFVVAARHKLIPSVYAAINIMPNSFGNKDAVGYSGPTYIAIRSGKHSSSTAHSHGLDIERLINLPEFHSITKFNGKVKPVLMLTVDGGPDENPRYEKTIKVGIHHFVKQDLDVLIIATNAPHRSAFNRAERRMAPLSKDLSGLILPHDHFGSHLNSKCETIDERKEKLNFQFAGEILSQIWSETVIDGYETVAEFILPEHSDLNAIEQKDEKWIAKHVLSSQYMTQIIKCNDRSCCSAARSSYFKIMKKNEMMPFLPPPVPLEQSDDGVVALKNRSHEHSKFASLFVLNSLHMEEVLSESYKEYGQVPYDLYCPSVQKNLKSRICGTCKKYFATVVMLKAHIKVCHRCVSTSSVALIRPRRIAAQRASELLAIIGQSENDEDAEWLNVDDVEEEPKSVLQIVCEERAAETKFPTVSIKQHFECPWVDNE